MPCRMFGSKGFLSEQLQEQYHRDGFIILPSVFSPQEVAEFQSEADRLLQQVDLIHKSNIRCRWKNNEETGTLRFDGFDPVIDISPVFERLARDERILGAISSVYGERGFLVMDRLIFKPPGAQGYGLHQDYISWPSFPKSFTTVIAAIDVANSTTGGTEMFPGFHHCGCMAPQDGRYHELSRDQVDIRKGVILPLAPGDLAVFSGFTPHRSAPNRSKRWRRLLYLSYNAASDGGDQRDAIYSHYKVRLMETLSKLGRPNLFFR
jgi:ectoine hydroxylase-related dioxygenase (phytanoyl-CoA dioxygenase family)